MRTIKITNGKICVVISTLGAEIQSVELLESGVNVIWNDENQQYWQRHAPILFPIIGRLNDNSYKYQGRKYELNQHGFLRDQEFQVIASDYNFVKLQSASNTRTRAKYPFDYRFQVLYQLVDNRLEICYQIENEDHKTMYYSLGLHPGFNINGTLDNYQLIFEPRIKEIKRLRVTPAPFIDGSSSLETIENGVLPLSYSLLNQGLVIVDTDNLESVILSQLSSVDQIEISLADFPYLAIWSPENQNAPFVCVEPFKGLPDLYGQPRNLQDKLGIQSILSGQTDEIKTSLTFN
ncbi:aldose 1-epimerase family protein [Lactobacillus pentosus]|jgi:galactose mutarotase-like enzyme|uniref:aldose 1-epimerase family protein n=1 Tax=Lactiplantibacillus pentosus TaxID=1589 RepID=UPI00128DA024|nr:aldose 1-epimerase family protein [Lactiplantibacillus pentosus]BBM22322.1 aldose 1-epimerase [Lactiplantibacillus plantarum]MCT3285913.1 aldose 1-epimerase family protein [Lactiplantibacillus pentosus]MCT3293593.1 aldose 1-epimerase family protein [Lactiplantibacillus pentosus]MPQ19312.1 aldose 1-epimerase family protein [Lactiplantibacillus pentosus]UXI96927.1 aldose 1-epimerase family protein [Lactiplantibacillus pentosus]